MNPTFDISTKDSNQNHSFQPNCNVRKHVQSKVWPSVLLSLLFWWLSNNYNFIYSFIKQKKLKHNNTDKSIIIVDSHLHHRAPISRTARLNRRKFRCWLADQNYWERQPYRIPTQHHYPFLFLIVVAYLRIVMVVRLCVFMIIDAFIIIFLGLNSKMPKTR